jgi:lipopolysaccharide/colanic/teichoic acid biosynthesis glycosyltransferase
MSSKGEMSLVGTRPPTLDEVEKYEPWHRRRISMKPGITGLWQVSGRNKITDFNEVVKLDLKYIDHWRFANDIKIILQTIWVVLRRKGAF